MRRGHLVYILIFLSGCNSPNSESASAIVVKSEGTSDFIAYAEKFSVERSGDYNLVTVYTPWQNAAESTFRYLLGSTGDSIPDSLLNYQFIRTPLKNAVIMSTTFVSFLDTLGEADIISGVSGGSNIYNPVLQSKYSSGTVREVGFDNNLNYEVLLDLEPEVVFMFGVQSGILQTIHKLQETGITVVICADYLEPHPLGRGEWLKFFSLFFGKERMADSIFSGIERNYNHLASQTSHNSTGPRVMLGLPWKDAWYIAGGRSFAARLISDAGGKYIFEDQTHSEAKPFSLETVFSRGLEADIWINPGVANDLNTILDHDQRFQMLNSFQKGLVFNNTKRIGVGGANDYWEKGVLRPDLVLEDLIKIFNDPKQLNNEDLHFYRRLK